MFFKFKNKKLKSSLLIAFAILLFCIAVPVLRKPSVDILEYPLKIIDFVGQEIKALIFFHQNFTENKILTQQVNLLKQKLVHSEEIVQENQRLRGLLSFKQEVSYRLVAAHVIARDPSCWNSVVIVDKGSNDGVKENAPVMGFAGLAGKVIESGSNTSKIMLLNDPGFKVSALIQRSRHEGLVTGTLENRLIMRYLLPDTDVKIGDSVITSGLSELFPKGMLIGTVLSIGEEYAGLNLYCVVKPAIDPLKLEEVMIIVK